MAMSEQLELIISIKKEGTAELNKIKNDINGVETAAANADSKGVGRFNTALGKVGVAAARTGAVLGTGLAAGIGASTKSALSFDTAMRDISTLISGDSTPAINELKSGIIDMSRTLPKSPGELGAAAYDVLSAGVQGTSNQLGVLENSTKLAVAGLGDTKGAVDIMTSSLNSFGIDAANSNRVADVLFKTVRNGKTTVDEMAQAFGATAPTVAAAGFSLEDFSAATAALTTTGLPASQAQNSLRQAIVSMTKPTKEMSQLFDALGTEGLPQMVAEGKTMGEIFVELDKAAGGNAETLTKAYGSVEAYSAALGVGQTVNDAYKNTLEDMTIGANMVEEATRKQIRPVDLFKTNIQALAIEMGDNFLPAINKFSQFLIDNQDTIREFASNGLEVAGEAFNFLRETVDRARPGIEGFMKAGNNLVDMFTSNESAINGLVNTGLDVLIDGFNTLGVVTGEVSGFLNENQNVLVALGAAFAAVKISNLTTQLNAWGTEAARSVLTANNLAASIGSFATAVGPAVIAGGIGLIASEMKEISDRSAAVDQALADMEQAFIDVGLAPERAAARMLEFAELQGRIRDAIKGGTVEELQALKQEFEDFQNEPLVAPEKAGAIIEGFRATGAESFDAYLQRWQESDPGNVINESILASVTQQSAQMGDVGAFVGSSMAQGLSSAEVFTKWQENGQVLTDEFVNQVIQDPAAYEQAGAFATEAMSRGFVTGESIAAIQASGFELNAQTVAALAQGVPAMLEDGRIKGALVAQGMGGEEAQALVGSAAQLLNSGATLQLSQAQIDFLNSGTQSAGQFATGISGQAPTAQAAGSAVAGAGDAGLKSRIAQFATSGMMGGQSFTQGVQGQAGAAQVAGSTVAGAGDAGLKSRIIGFATSGAMGGQSFAQGVANTSGQAQASGSQAGAAAGQGAQSGMSSNVSGRLTPIMAGEMRGVEAAANNVRPSFSGLISAAQSAAASVSAALSSATAGIGNIEGLQSRAAAAGISVPGNASGTGFFPGGITAINERGDEYVELPRGSRIRNVAETRRMMRDSSNEPRGVVQNINTNIYSEVDGKKLLNSMLQVLTPA